MQKGALISELPGYDSCRRVSQSLGLLVQSSTHGLDFDNALVPLNAARQKDMQISDK